MGEFHIILIGTTVLALAVIGVLARLMYFRSKSQDGSVQAASQLVGSLRDAQQQSHIILSAIEDGVVMVDAQKTIQSFNPGAAKITGWPVEEAGNLAIDSVIKLVDGKDISYTEEQNLFNRALKEGKTVHDNTAMLVSRADKRIALNISVTPLIEDHRVSGAVAVFRDVSQERQQEQQRAEFISTASHEMRTPVAAIEGYLALALNDKVSTIDTRARDYLQKAHASTQHLGQLFQDLLTSAKAEDGRLSSHPEVIEMGAFLQQLSNDLKFSAEKKGLFTDFTLGASDVIDASETGNGAMLKPLYYAYADAERMREVITNLFDNAVKYTDSGKVSLGLTGNNDVVQVYIKDTGPGIAAEDISHLFQKFYRVDNSATRTIGGTGLGLFICRKIVELYKGHIWVDSTVGKGSTFFINLPRLTSQRAEQLQANDAGKAGLPNITSLGTS